MGGFGGTYRVMSMYHMMTIPRGIVGVWAVAMSVYIICMWINELLGDMIAVWGYDVAKVGY